MRVDFLKRVDGIDRSHCVRNLILFAQIYEILFLRSLLISISIEI